MAVLLGPRHEHLIVGHHHGHEVRFQGVAVHEALRDELAACVHVLDLLGRDILALRQLKDVLLAVDDLEAPAGEPQPDIPRVQPALCVHHLVRLVLRLVVPQEHAGSAHAHLAARVGLVSRGVVHLCHAVQLDLAARHGRPHVPAGKVALVRLADDACALRHAVPLEHHPSEANAQELHHLRADGRAARGHVPHAPAQLLAQLGEHQLLPQQRRRPPLLQRLLLGGVRPREQLLLHKPALADPRVHLVVDAVPQPRHRAEHRGLELRDVVQQAQHVAAEEPRLGPREEAHQHGDALVDVRQGQVGDVRVARHQVQVVGVRCGVGDKVEVRQHDPLGVPRGAAGVADGGQGVLPRRHRRRRALLARRQHLLVRHHLAVVGHVPGHGGQRGVAAVRVHDDELDGGALAQAAQHDGQARQADAHRGELCMVADEPHGVGPQGVVQRHRDGGDARHGRLQQAPLRAVDGVEPHVLARAAPHGQQPRGQCGARVVHRLVADEGVLLGLPRRGVHLAQSEGGLVAMATAGALPQVVQCLDGVERGGVPRHQLRGRARVPVDVELAVAEPLGQRNRILGDLDDGAGGCSEDPPDGSLDAPCLISDDVAAEDFNSP
mmetsp:Transcript_15960/g.38838  ORF Transcript_15960/g.38838 Transcript_15960/m.38838 type:complete len:608 (-) Transcript_15960:73-1896(-)